MNKRIVITASLFGILAVVLGAFGAHGLKSLVNADSLEVWKKGVEYHFYHTFALLFLSTFVRFKSRLINASYLCFSLGIVLFSGSLYILTLKNLLHLNTQFIGPITPVGGLFFILGWIFLLLSAIKYK